jgi:Asp-tRNA(Asn)/Glu-tRNA(Gln) amidotransferase A subunit family amidase
MTEPCDLSAVDARRLIGSRRLSPVELLESCLGRIDAVDGRLNALVSLDAEAAMDQARAAERAVMSGAALGPLHGLPLAIKDLNATRGLRTTWGSLLYRDHVPEDDDASVAAMRAAGAVVLAKSNTPEFGAGGNTWNRVFGATGNPYAPERTCGGSSGGAAVALAAGMVPLANGSDYGGSLRTPAAFCGVVGYRPSPGVVPAPGRPAGLLPFSVQGPMGRDLDDTLLLLQAQTGRHPDDPWAQGLVPPPANAAEADLAALRVAMSPDLGCAPVDDGVRATFARKLAAVQGAFGRLESQDPDFGPVHEVFDVTRALNFVAAHGDKVAQHRDRLGPNVVAGVDDGARYTLADTARALTGQTQVQQQLRGFFDRYDLLIAPGAAVPPFPHTELYPRTVGGAQMPHYMRWLALSYAPTMALCCAVCLPCGRDSEGLPFGLQLIARQGDDARLLAAARAIERVLAAEPETAPPAPDVAALAGPAA